MDNGSLVEALTQMIPAQSDAPGKGLIAFVKSQSQDEIRNVALSVGAQYPSGPAPVYLVSGRVVGEHAWPFSRIKKGPRIRLDVGEGVTEIGGTIFPENNPIVLLAEDVDFFDALNQRAYCHLSGLSYVH